MSEKAAQMTREAHAMRNRLLAEGGAQAPTPEGQPERDGAEASGSDEQETGRFVRERDPLTGEWGAWIPVGAAPVLVQPAPAPFAWLLEYGACSLPMGHPSRVTVVELYATKEEAVKHATTDNDFDWRVYPITLAGAVQPAPAEKEKP